MIAINHPARVIPGVEKFNNKTQEFFTTPDIHVPAIHLKLEHSLMSIAKWESKWHKPFDPMDLNDEEFLDYIRCMNVNPTDNTDTCRYLSQKDLTNIMQYMLDPCTAWVDPTKAKNKKKNKPQPVEAIYYAMIKLEIPPEYEKWHINRLTALINYFSYQDGGQSVGPKQQKKSAKEIMMAYHELNQANRKKYNSKG